MFCLPTDGKGHVGKNCRSTYKCFSCNERHHSSICVKTFPSTSPTTSSQPGLVPNVPVQGNKQHRTSVPTTPPVRTPSLLMYIETHTPVLLQTAVTIVRNPRQLSLSTQTRIILDSGSQCSYITQGLKEDLVLCPERAERVVVKTFGSTDEKALHCDVVKLLMKTTYGDDLELEFLVVPLICEALSGQVITCALDNHPHLVGLDLAEIGTGTTKKVDVLIGSDHYWKVVSGEIVRGSTGPTALKSRFGWILSGPLSGLMECSTISNLACCQTLLTNSDPLQKSDTELEIALRRFWDVESLGIQGKETTLYEKFVNSIAFINNRYPVRLPWKEYHPTLPSNYKLSEDRLMSLLRRLRQSPEILKEYDSIIREQLRNGIIESVPLPHPHVGKVHYIPHHAVVRHDKETTKIRIVYDASARSDGPSLNDCLYADPSFDQNILDLIIRFRLYKIAIIGDIEKVILMISVAPDALRFLWVDDSSVGFPQIVEFRFARVVFGVSSSPFLLNGTLKYHVETFKAVDPKFVDKFSRSIYVDDFVSGADEEGELYDLYQKCKVWLNEGGFNMRKFTCSCPALQQKIDHQEGLLLKAIQERRQTADNDQTYTESTLGDKQCQQETQRVLGVQWNSMDDHFVIDVRHFGQLARELEPTRRNIVGLVARFYDPLGVISPVTVQLKIFAQELCGAKLSWDEQITGSLIAIWKKLVAGLQGTEPFRVYS